MGSSDVQIGKLDMMPQVLILGGGCSWLGSFILSMETQGGFLEELSQLASEGWAAEPQVGKGRR